MKLRISNLIPIVSFFWISTAFAFNWDKGFDQGPLSANQITVDCSAWSKNLSCAQKNQQDVDNVLDQLTTSGGAAWTLTDGTHTVANVSQVTVTGGVVGGTTPNATLTITGGTPSPPVNAVQYYSSGSFAGNAGFIFDGTNVGIGTSTATDSLFISSSSGGETLNGAPASQANISQTVLSTHDFVGSGAGIHQRLGQTFTTTSTATVKSVAFSNFSLVGSPVNFVCDIETISAGLPTGTLVNGSATVTLSSVSSGVENTCTFPSTFSLAAGTYAITFAEASPQSNGNFWYTNYNAGDVYAGGNEVVYNGSSWSASASNDMYFKVNFVGSTPQLSFQEQGTSTADIRTNGAGNFYIDGATPNTAVFDIINGNVGIGSSTVPNKLYVAGTGEMQGFKMNSGASSGYVLTSNSVGVGTWQPAAAGGGTGTVTSVTLATPNSTLSLGGTNPVTTSGTINADLNLGHTNNWTADQDFAGNVGVGTTLTGTAKLSVISGNVGIGTWIPGFALDVASSDSGTTLTNASAAMMNLVNTNTTANNFVDYGMSATNSSGANVVGAKISGVATSHTASSESMDIAFLTRNAGTSGERMRITAAGNIGVGTTTPQGAMVVTNGNVGIGTWAPTALLEVTNNAIAATSTDGMTLSNYTASLVGTQKQLSPRLHLIGQGWKSDATTGSKQTEWYIEDQPVGAATLPGNSLEFVPIRNAVTGAPIYFCQANTGSPKTGIFGLDGSATAGSTTCSAGASFTGFGEINAANVFGIYSNGSAVGNVSASGIGIGSSKFFQWFSGNAGNSATGDTVLSRVSAGNVGIGTSGSGTGFTNGRLLLGNIGIGTTLTATSALAVMSGNVGIGTWIPSTILDITGGKVRIAGGGSLATSGTAPTVANNACGTTTQGTVTAKSTNFSGKLTAGTLNVTSCAMTFDTTISLTGNINCICQDDTTTTLGTPCTATTTVMTVTSATSMSGDTITYFCSENI